MPLTLVTGPANAAKAGEVLGGLRSRLDEEPILVVPTFADVEHAQRELAERGAVFGARVLRFERLFGAIAERAGYGEPVASQVQRELLIEATVASAELLVLAESARRPGFVRAAVRLVAELGGARVDPARFTQALRAWAGEGPRRTYADEVAGLYRGYRRGLGRAGLVDPELFAWRALDALRLDPDRWAGTPVYFYGFDDFTTLELDALETLAVRCGAPVSVSLPFEAGRPAFRATAATHARLAELATERRDLPAVDDHYAPEARAALHQVERGLFQTEPPTPVPAGGAVAFHTAGGARAEVELAAKRVLDLLRGGVSPGEVAVIFRDPGAYSSLVEQVFGAYGVPYSIDRSVSFAHTGLGRGLVALVRCTDPGGSADDLLAYLRTPGLLDQPALADRLESAVRRQGAHDAARARGVWEREHWGITDLERLSHARGVAEFLRELEAILARMFAAPYKRRAPVLAGPELDDPRVFAAGQRALAELRALVESGAAPGVDHARVKELLVGLRVHVGENPQPDRVQVARPEAVRARRFTAVLILGLQEGEFPGGSRPDPFLPDDTRRAVAMASGLSLPLREDRLDRERYLFYVCASRAERLLVLSSRTSDEDGTPEAPSFFVDDVGELLEGLGEPVARSLGQVTWDPAEAPTAAEWDRALAARGPRRSESRPGPLTSPALLAELEARESVSASALERFADCPVKWLVESILRPEALEPDPEQMVRGQFAHEVLERTFRRLPQETGEARVRRSTLVRAEEILLEELREGSSRFSISPQQTRVRAAARRLEFDLVRHLAREADRDGSFAPHSLELVFGVDGGPGAVEIAEGLRVSGRIDRVDTAGELALVIDYKSGKNVDRYKVASWRDNNRFQAALYMLAAEKLLGKSVVGGVYVALGSRDARPRGMLAKDVDALGTVWFDNDRLPADRFEEMLDWARERIRETDEAMRRGQIRCTPESCAWNGGCSYPSLCRSEA